jgi:hypothetical protein
VLDVVIGIFLSDASAEGGGQACNQPLALRREAYPCDPQVNGIGKALEEAEGLASPVRALFAGLAAA